MWNPCAALAVAKCLKSVPGGRMLDPNALCVCSLCFTENGTSTCYIFIILWCLCGCFSLTYAHGGQSGIFFPTLERARNHRYLKKYCGKRMMHQHDSKQHFLKRFGYISHKCQTIVPCLNNMFCRGCSYVQGGEFLLKPALGWWELVSRGQNGSPTSSGQSLGSSSTMTWFPFPSLWSQLLLFGQQLSLCVFGEVLELWHSQDHRFDGEVPHASDFSFMWLPWLAWERKNCR